MNIALFHEVVSGGARRGANEFAKALRAKGHTVDLYIVDQKEPTTEKVFYTEVYYYPFVPKVWKGKNWKIKLYKDTVELWNLYRLHQSIAQDIEKRNYDFVFIHPSQYTQAPFLLRFLTVPKMYYCQEPLRMIYEVEMDETTKLGFWKMRYERSMRKIRKVIDKGNITMANILLANSTFTQRNIRNAYGLSSTVCHMGVDGEKFHEASKKKDIDILFIGSEDPIDGYDLFQSTSVLLDKKVHLVSLLRGKKWLTNDRELVDHYSRAKLVLCFGKKEPFGLVPLEAMSCGAVIVALHEGGYQDSVQDGKTGFLVPENSQTIAHIINTILQDTEKLSQMSKQAKEDMKKNWTWNKSAETVLAQYILWGKDH